MSEFPTAGAAREQSKSEAQKKREAQRNEEARLRAQEDLRVAEVLPQIKETLSRDVLAEITNAIKAGKNTCEFETSNYDTHNLAPYRRAANDLVTELKAQGYKASQLVWTSDGWYDGDIGHVGPWLNVKINIDWSAK